MKNLINHFLTSNGFKCFGGVYRSSRCEIIMSPESLTIISPDGRQWNYKKLSVYWIIGVLTHHELIEKNFKPIEL